MQKRMHHMLAHQSSLSKPALCRDGMHIFWGMGISKRRYHWFTQQGTIKIRGFGQPLVFRYLTDVRLIIFLVPSCEVIQPSHPVTTHCSSLASYESRSLPSASWSSPNIWYFPPPRSIANAAQLKNSASNSASIP